jgi:hypothetical protein
MPNYSPTGEPQRPVAKTNINTARFGELWRSFWNVMVDQNVATGTPFSTITPGGVMSYAEMTYRGNHYSILDQSPTTGGPLEDHPQQMFRSSLRDMRAPTLGVYFTPDQQMLLRAAIAAVNAEDLRDPDNVPTRRDVGLSAEIEGAGLGDPSVGVVVSIFGMEPQPYITEVYVNTDNIDPGLGGGPNPRGYVAIELYNPYPVDIEIDGWGLAVIDRRPPVLSPPAGPANSYPAPPPGGVPGGRGLSYFYIHAGPPATPPTGATPPTPMYTFPAGTVVPANGYLVIDNFDATDPEAAKHHPNGVSPTGTPVYVPNLHWVIEDTATNQGLNKEWRGGELVLLRPVGPGAPVLDDPTTGDGNAIPVDSFDFTGIISADRYDEIEGDPAAIPTQFTSWHYVRDNVTGTGSPSWKFVYPGRYMGDAASRRHQGTIEETWLEPNPAPPPSTTVTLGAPNTTGASYPTIHTIQMASAGFPGPNPVMGGGNEYPFGGFMRDGDILQVPFIGAYRVAYADDTRSTLELNAVTMDAAFANDTDLANDEQVGDAATAAIESREQVGRFMPLRHSDWTMTPPHLYNDLYDGDFDLGSTDAGNKWRYRWAIDLFDHLTVQSPGNDYLPNVPTNNPAYTPARQPVDNNGDTIVGSVDGGTVPVPGQEDTVPIHGAININTAPWKTLSAVPFVSLNRPAGELPGDNYTWTPAPPGPTVPPGGGTWTAMPDGEDDNVTLAREIVRWRDGAPMTTATPQQQPNGPFRTIWDLYKVPAFKELQDTLHGSVAPAVEPDDEHGDFSPLGTGAAPTPDGVRGDFEEQNLLLTRVSNVITTRSDSFTVYLVVQGWANAGQANAELVVQRRAAFIIDRSSVTNTNSTPEIHMIPND